MPFLGDIGTGCNQTHAFDPDILSFVFLDVIVVSFKKDFPD